MLLKYPYKNSSSGVRNRKTSPVTINCRYLFISKPFKDTNTFVDGPICHDSKNTAKQENPIHTIVTVCANFIL